MNNMYMNAKTIATNLGKLLLFAQYYEFFPHIHSSDKRTELRTLLCKTRLCLSLCTVKHYNKYYK